MKRCMIMACLMIAASVTGAGSTMLNAAQPATLEIGQPAPDFALPGVDDKTHRLADFAEAKVLVIVFTCNHCPTAQAYESRIQQLNADYRDRDVALVAISPNDALAVRLDELGYTDVGDSLADMKIRAKDRGFDFPYLYDGDEQRVSRAYGPVATPHVFVFDQQRMLRFTGRIDDSAKPEQVRMRDARAAIDALLADQPIAMAKTPTFGCSVKWSDKRSAASKSLEQWNREKAALKTIDAKGLRGLVANDTDKLRVINVWATWCGPCVKEFPELITMHRMYRKRDFELITISMDQRQQMPKVSEFLNSQHASCQNFIFSGRNEYELIENLDPQWQGALPFTMIVAPGGQVVYRKQSAFDPLEVRKTIADNLGRVY